MVLPTSVAAWTTVGRSGECGGGGGGWAVITFIFIIMGTVMRHSFIYRYIYYMICMYVLYVEIYMYRRERTSARVMLYGFVGKLAAAAASMKHTRPSDLGKNDYDVIKRCVLEYRYDERQRAPKMCVCTGTSTDQPYVVP